jgi:hypothetical protein
MPRRRQHDACWPARMPSLTVDASPCQRVRDALRNLLSEVLELSALATSPAVACLAARIAHLPPRAQAALLRALLRELLLARARRRVWVVADCQCSPTQRREVWLLVLLLICLAAWRSWEVKLLEASLRNGPRAPYPRPCELETGASAGAVSCLTESLVSSLAGERCFCARWRGGW